LKQKDRLVLLLQDECHFGVNKDGQMDSFLSYICSDTSVELNNLVYLAISATPYSHLSESSFRIVPWNKEFEEKRLEAEDDVICVRYFGPLEYQNSSRILSSSVFDARCKKTCSPSHALLDDYVSAFEILVSNESQCVPCTKETFQGVLVP
jgi:hypothetical protein